MTNPGDKDSPAGPVGWLKWLWTTENGLIAFLREVAGSILIVLLVGGLLFGISGVWPPMVAIESPSMEPHIQKGDLVFVMDEHRFSGEAAINHNGKSTGVIPYQQAQQTDHKKFGTYGDVIIYKPDGSERQTPIIHRARFWVEEGENWYDKANPDHIGNAENCEELSNCPAEHSGFITKGDNKEKNGQYDQVVGLSEPVKPTWIIGTAVFRIPYLGSIRLLMGMISGHVASAAGMYGGLLGTGMLGGAIVMDHARS
ncbi:S26 family signal peptidase [Halocatena salina]|uniref:S26 family signal peptidase n=1 Tax=Halocatena salina TaxID=2934340 RepID=A0A8U0A1D6_9EURY|nr:S26 family signal peptidase [Halocatena salina]UPM41873.1 S26 family signal peptidase [Halocatena salina]